MSTVSITVSKQTSGISRVGFGTPMIMSCEAELDNIFGTTAKVYTDPADMITDGFASNGLTYLAALRLFGQENTPDKIYVGKRSTLPTQIITVTIATAVDNLGYTLTINGAAFLFTAGVATTPILIAAGLVSAINLGAENVLAVDNIDGTFTVTGAATPGGIVEAGRTFTMSVSDRAKITRQDSTVDAGVVADLTTIRNAIDGSDDWYGLVLDTSGPAELTALAATIETLQKIFGFTTADEDILESGSSDIASTLQALSYANTFGCWHPDPHENMVAAWMGKVLPDDPGENTWKFQTLTGIAATNFTSTEAANLTAKGMNSYQEEHGKSNTYDGVMIGGEFIDITRFIHWWAQRVNENIYLQLDVLKKVPFTNLGIAIVENEIRGVNALGITAGGIATSPEPTVTVPNDLDVPVNDRAIRNLPNVLAGFRLAGAVHTVDVAATVTV
ncbi:MAG: DUF3383 family protein [Desulfobacteraceae bacterium]|nr:DUF3383 family protein [Desulfobacteraceae bacterium]